MSDCILIVDLDRLSDSETLPVLKERVGDLLAGKPVGIIFNGRKVEMIDSTIIGYLFWIQQHLKADGNQGEAVVSEASRFLRHAISMVGLESTMRTFPNDADALAHLRK